ncbi:amidase [Siccirubricoccus sp. KC 17139]|uniref:Amidase n=1 Tax=Siccirubricoccus soli TaxID=2899147 RepID=A0ABT1DAR8_9PROT|nr:amidase family protein [Siccirubricoccus soli]MCO6419034.1 amidase [Siccirubricoccus soli]MCP2685169.1 amidase family protein [Siccirubricoccus soli]
MSEELIRLTATEAVARLKRKEVSPLALVEAAAARIAAVEPAVNALPTLCLDRARDHARRIMAGEGAENAGHPGWLAGLPVTIKDLADVAGVRTTYGSPIFKDHVPARSHPLVERIERLGGIVLGKSNTPEFGAGGSTFNEVFGRTRNPWNTALTCGGSTGGGAVSVATGEAWLAHGTDHAGSLRRPGTYCGVVGLRPSPGRVTRGTANNLFSPLSVHGPMARTVADVALFLDTMAGWDLADPLTWEAPAVPYAASLAPRRFRIGYTADFHGRLPVDREMRALCDAAVRRFAEAGCVVEEAAPELGDLQEAFLVLRSQHFVVDRELQLQTHRDLIKPDIIWNTERGLAATPSRLAWAERERAAWYRRVAAHFGQYDLLVTPGAATPAFDVMLRHPESVAGVKLENYMAASMLNAAITLAGCPAVAIPCGLDQYGRPVGLQIAAPPRQEATALAAAALFESLTGLDRAVPIDPRPGAVPPPE